MVLVQPHTTPYSIFSATVLFQPRLYSIYSNEDYKLQEDFSQNLYFFSFKNLYFLGKDFKVKGSVFVFVTPCLIYSCSSVEYDTAQN